MILIKRIFIFISIFLISFELASIIATNLNLLIFNEKPIYFKKISTRYDWLDKKDGKFYHKKNFTTKFVSQCFDVDYQFNNVGARDNVNYYTDKNEETNIENLALIGDSFAEGFGVEIDKIFAKIIEKSINKKILNFGISGSNTRQHFFDYINENSKYNFKELIYFFLPHNDFINESNVIEKKKYKKSDDKYFFYKLKFFLDDLSKFLARFTYSHNTLKTLNYYFQFYNIDNFENKGYFFDNKLNIDQTYDYLERLITFKKVKSYIVIIPTIYDINNFFKNEIKYKEYYWYKKLNQLGLQNNTNLIDLMDYVNFEDRHLYFHSCDGHWSEFGNSFFADVFLKNY